MTTPADPAPPGATGRPWRHRVGPVALAWAPRILLGLAGLLPLGVLYYVFWGRLSYPLDLEWMEGGMLMHAKRVADGQGLYVPPSVDFGSFLYTPLYPWILGGLGKVFGLSYTLGRALSVLCFTATFALILRSAQRAGQGSAAALAQGPGERTLTGPGVDGLVFAVVACGAVAAAYDFTGGWYDLVRNDGLQLALSAGGLYALGVAGRRWRGVVVAGVLLGLAFFAKQTAVFPILAAGAGMCLIRLRLVPLLVAVVGAVAGLGTLLINRLSDGWFWFYVFELHQSHRTTPAQIWEVSPRLLWGHGKWLYVAAGVALGLWAVASVLRRRWATWTPLWLFAALGGVVSGAVGRATQWSENNAYIPAIVFPAAFVAIAAAETAGLLALRPQDEAATGWRGRLLAHPGWLRAAAWLPAVLLGLHVVGAGRPDVKKHVPDARAWAQAKRHIAALRRLGREGEVFVPYHPWYSVIAGGRGHGHIMNVNDVNFTRPLKKGAPAGWSGDPHRRRTRVLEARRRLLGSIRKALSGGRFAVVIHDRAVVARWRRSGVRALPVPNWSYRAQVPGLMRGYRLEWDLAWEGAHPRMWAGNPAAPRFVWRRPRPATPPRGGRVVFDFERSDHAGWEVAGTAFGRGPVDGVLWDPHRRTAQGLVAGAGGRRWVSSFHGGDAATGRLRSPPFLLDQPVLKLRVGGGKQPGALEVRLEVDGKAVHRATGPNEERLRTVRWDVKAHQGRRARLVVVDEARGGWGHLQLDEVWLVP